MKRLFRTPAREEILHGHALRMMARIGFPAVISSVLFTLYNLADAFWIGRLPGEQAREVMAGIQISWPFFWFIVSFVAGFGGAAVSALVAQHMGAGRPKHANFALNQLFTISIFAGIVLGVAGYITTPHIVSFLVRDAAVARHASTYLGVIFLGLPTMLLPQLFFFAFSATGDTVTPLLVTVIGIGINIALDPLLILGLSGFPQMGILGAAIATVAAQAVSTLVFLWLFRRGKGDLRYDRSALRLRYGWLVKALRIGTPAAAGQSAVALGFVVLIWIIGRLDHAETALAGYGVADRIFGLLFIVTEGLGIGLTTMVGQALGAGMMDRARHVVRKGVGALIGILVIEALVLWLARSSLVAVFMPGQDAVIREGARFIELFAVGMPLLGAFFAAEAIYRGAGYNVPPMILGGVRLWGLRLPLAYLFAFTLQMQADGVWLGMSLSNVISGLASIGLLLSNKWQRTRVDEADETAVPA